MYLIVLMLIWICCAFGLRAILALKVHKLFTGAENYQRLELPTANMADVDPGTDRYLLFMQISSKHSGVWDLYTTEYHVFIYLIPPFDTHAANFGARRCGRKRQADGNLQLEITIIPYCKLLSVRGFLSHHLAVTSRHVNQLAKFSKCKHAILSYTNLDSWNVCLNSEHPSSLYEILR